MTVKEVATVVEGVVRGREWGVCGEGCSRDRVTRVTVGVTWRGMRRVGQGPGSGTHLHLQKIV